MNQHQSDDGTTSAVQSKYRDACRIAGQAPPVTERECLTFAAQCLRGAKIKAELLAKVSQSHLSHTEALGRVASLSGFADGWHGLTTYSKQFPTLSAVARASDVRSIGLAILAWNLTDEVVAEFPLAQTVTRLVRNNLSSIYQNSEVGDLTFRRLFFQAGSAPEHWRGYSPSEVGDIFTELLSWAPSFYVTSCLTRVPVAQGAEACWPPLTEIKVEELPSMQLANPGLSEGFGYRGWEHLAASMLPALTAWAQVVHPYEDGRQERNARLKRLEEPSTRISCREIAEKGLASIGQQSIFEALSVPAGDDGFITSLYQGTPEDIERTLFDVLPSGHELLKRITFKEPLGAQHVLTIFRIKYYTDEFNGSGCYNAEAVLHDTAGELVAKVGLVLSVVPLSYNLSDLVGHLDVTADNDVQELALGIVDAAVDDEAFLDDEWRRLMLVRDWEVRAQDRGQGLGRLLLSAACKKAFRGLPGPTCVAAKVWPPQLVPTARQCAAGLPEIDGPRHRLADFWLRDVVGAGLLPKSSKVHLQTGHYPMMHHSDHSMELFAMGGATVKAIKHEQRYE